MTPQEIQTLRRALGENAATFGKRFAKSGRTVEGWERASDPKTPDPFILKALEQLAARLAKKGGK